MAIPENRKFISTNLPFPRLNIVLDALEKENVSWIPGKTSLVGEGGYGEFDLEGMRYGVEEDFELVKSLVLISANPDLVQTLIQEHEEELAVMIKSRDYDQAQMTNDMIYSLNKILS